MCTVSWVHHGDGYELFFNRDERLTRHRAHPPSVRRLGNVSLIAPTDGDFGGTWIATNEFGITVCLVNAYEFADRSEGRPRTSRGLLVLELSPSRSLEELSLRLFEKDPRRFAPFKMVGLDPTGESLYSEWSGISLLVEHLALAESLLISSGYDLESVKKHRRALYAPIFQRPASERPRLLEVVHESHDPNAGPLSVCMHRDDARTVSLSHVRVGPDRSTFRYIDGSPCRSISASETTLVLPRRSV